MKTNILPVTALLSMVVAAAVFPICTIAAITVVSVAGMGAILDADYGCPRKPAPCPGCQHLAPHLERSDKRPVNLEEIDLSHGLSSTLSINNKQA